MPQISLSSGGTFRTLPISSLAPATSCELGLYVPSDCRFFRAVMTRMKTTKIASNAHRVEMGIVTASHGTRSLCPSLCRTEKDRSELESGATVIMRTYKKEIIEVR